MYVPKGMWYWGGGEREEAPGIILQASPPLSINIALVSLYPYSRWLYYCWLSSRVCLCNGDWPLQAVIEKV